MAPSLNLCIVLALAGLASANPLPPRDDVSINAESGQEFAFLLDNDRSGDSPGQCPKVVVRAPVWTWGPTRTVWTTTATATQIIDCGGCDQLTISDLFLGHGPVVFFTATTTATEPSITTELKCGHPTATSAPTSLYHLAPAVEATPAPSL